MKIKNARPTIGLLLEHTLDVEEGYQTGILDGAAVTVRRRDVNLLCFIGGALNGIPTLDFHSQRNILYGLEISNNVDGLIILGSMSNYTSVAELNNLHTSYHPLPTLSIGITLPDIPSVVVDNTKGMRRALTHLIEVHNYRRIAFIRGPEESLEAQMRYRVYKEVLANYDIPLDPELIAPGDFVPASGEAAIRLLLDQRQVSFEAVVAANDNMALGALEALQARGIVVPYDVALVGFDDIKQARTTVPSLTTVRQPLFELGKQAVEILLARITNEEVSEQTVLPTELMVRRSCGCPTSSASQVSQTVTGAGENLERLFSTKRDAILAELSQVMNFSTVVVSPGWEEQLLDAFYDDLTGQSEGRFLSNLDRILRQAMKDEEDVSLWQEVVSVLRRYIKAVPGKDGLTVQAKALLQQAQLFIAEEARSALAQQFLRQQRQNVALRTIGQSLITMFDLGKLMDTIAEGMPQLDIPSCYLALYEDPRPYRYPQPPPEWSRLVLAWDENGRVALQSGGRRFRLQTLLPEGILPQERRYNMMIEALYFQEEQLGFVMFERGPREGNIYEVLRGQIASAIKGAFLLQARQRAEEELRKHRDHLDELVQKRTVQLSTTNEHLRQEIEERKRAEVALRQSQHNLTYAQKVAKLGYYYWYLQTDEMVWSDEIYRIFGVSKAEYEPSPELFGQFLHPDDLLMFSEEKFGQNLKQKTHQMEFRIIDRTTDALKHLFLWGETTFDDNGYPVSIFGIIQDITKRRQAEIQLETYTAELERSNRELQQFAYVASHDLQEPLRKIQAFGDRLQQKYQSALDETGLDYLNRMQNAASRMQSLIVDLLTFSRVRTHKQPFKKVDLHQIIMQILQDLEITIAELGADISVAELPSIDADALQMKQLFQNLLGNALKFSRPDVPPKIRVLSRKVEPFCEISVIDNGIGFDEKYLDRIFTMFVRLHSRDTYPGTGVGLAICRGIVERHEGYIHAASKPGEGATFTVGFPVK